MSVSLTKSKILHVRPLLVYLWKTGDYWNLQEAQINTNLYVVHQKASAKNSSKLNKFLHSEVNLLIQHIIVQDQDRQNNKI